MDLRPTLSATVGNHTAVATFTVKACGSYSWHAVKTFQPGENYMACIAGMRQRSHPSSNRSRHSIG